MTLRRLYVGALLVALVAFAAQLVAGMGLRHLPSEPESALDEENMSIPRRMEVQEYMEAMQGPTLYCYAENNFDYVDNDIGSAPATSPSQCCWLCHTTLNCKAWSWSNHNTGTCWFKSKRGDVVYKQGVQSAMVFYAPQPTCTLQVGTDYVDNDLARVDSQTAGGCCDLCKNYPKCRAFSWNSYLGGSCWLKSAKGATVPNPDVKSAEVYPAPIVDPPPTCIVDLKFNTDYFDNDIGYVSGVPVSSCCSLCKNWSGGGTCRAFSWSNFNGGTCWLKSLKGQVVNKAGVISAVVFPNPPAECTIEHGVDYFDHDIANAPSTTAEGCCSICKNWGGGGVCKAFSWTNFNTGTCWLKSAKGAPIANPNVKSATV